MYFKKSVGVLFIFPIFVLELNLVCIFGEGHNMISLNSVRENEEYSREICSSFSNHKGGSYGNSSRRLKKVHRKPSTTKSTTIALTTTTEDVPDWDEELTTVTEYTELESKNRRSFRSYRDKRSVEHMSKGAMKARAMYASYRGSDPVVRNSISPSLRREGSDSTFITPNCTLVVAQAGTTAVLHCEVADITENTVTWLRRKDHTLLTVGLVSYSTDKRFMTAHGKYAKDWALHVRFATPSDAGYYECQVPTHPPTSIFFKLSIVGNNGKLKSNRPSKSGISLDEDIPFPDNYLSINESRKSRSDLKKALSGAAYADILGEPEKIVHDGSMLRLTCMLRKSTEPPSYVFWYFGNRMINYDLNGINVENERQSSELLIERAEPRHSGNYTCVPANARSASVTVHVVQSEVPAAMQHGNGKSSSSSQVLVSTNFILQLLLYYCLLYSKYSFI